MSSTARRSNCCQNILYSFVLLMVCWSVVIATNPVVADEPSANPVTSAVKDENSRNQPASASDVQTAATPHRLSERQRKAYIALFALVGIVIAGLALLALTMLWARRLRRQLRQPIPQCELPVRDFWFLKPSKPTVSESSLPDSHLPPHEPPTTPS